MTDRVSSLIVVLEQDYREDDIEHLTGAIEHLRGVLKVVSQTADLANCIAEQRVRRELTDKLFQVLYPGKV